MSEEKKQEEEIKDNINVSTSEIYMKDEVDASFEQLEEQRAQKNRIKNLTSAVILLAGLFAGSLFVDAAQFFSETGYSERALKNAQVFEGGGKTWVAFPDPVVQMYVISVDDDEMKTCPKCDPGDVIKWMKKFLPTVVSKKVDANSEEGKKLINQFNVKSLPAFVLDSKLKDTEFYNGEAKVLFMEKQGQFVLNSHQLGVPAGKYLEMPVVGDNDPTIGSKDAKVKLIVYSDYQCPYCKSFYSIITKVAKEYGDRVLLTYKEYPLEFHPQAENAAMAALCAGKQGKFWEMGDLLFSNQDTWGKSEGKEGIKNISKKISSLNQNDFLTCLDNQEFQAQIDKDVEEAKSYGVSGTPSAFIGSQFIGGLVQENDLKKMIDAELEKNQ